MDIKTAQADVRRIYRYGFVGQLVSGVIWLIAATLASTHNYNTAIAFFFIIGMFIFPLTSLIIKLLGGPSALPKGHPMIGLAMQIAFTVPIALLVAIVLGLTSPELFFCAAMLIVGAHYLPFCFLYGMKTYIALAATLILCAFMLVYLLPNFLYLSGWMGGVILIAYSLILYAMYRRKRLD